MSTTSTDQLQGMLGRSFGAALAFGLATIALGVILMVFTEQSVAFFAVIVGIYLIFSGIFLLVASFSSDAGDTGMRVLSAIAGLFSVLLGIVAFRGISQAVAVLALLVGVGWVVRGVAELIEGIANPGMPARGWVIFIGALEPDRRHRRPGLAGNHPQRPRLGHRTLAGLPRASLRCSPRSSFEGW